MKSWTVLSFTAIVLFSVGYLHAADNDGETLLDTNEDASFVGEAEAAGVPEEYGSDTVGFEERDTTVEIEPVDSDDDFLETFKQEWNQQKRSGD